MDHTELEARVDEFHKTLSSTFISPKASNYFFGVFTELIVREIGTIRTNELIEEGIALTNKILTKEK